MEKDDEVKGDGNSYTTEFRQYDPRIGRWLSLDPLMAQFPWMSPYVAYDNNPVYYIDPYGLESNGEPLKPGEPCGGDEPKKEVHKKDKFVLFGRVSHNGRKVQLGTFNNKKAADDYLKRYPKSEVVKVTELEEFTIKPKRNESSTFYTDTRHSMAEAPIDKMIPGDVVKQSLYDPYGVDYTNGILPDYREYIYLGDGEFILTKKFKREGSDLVIEGAMIALPVGRVFKVVGAGIKLMRMGKGLSVIGPRATYREFAKKIGAKYLKVTDATWTWEKNLKYLKGIVKRGDDVIFAGAFDPTKLDKASVLAKEIKFLEENGYKWVDDFSRMVKE